MNTNLPNLPITNNYQGSKVVYSLRVKCELKNRGFEPILEMDSEHKPGFKCQVYNDTEEFEEAFSEIMRGGR